MSKILILEVSPDLLAFYADLLKRSDYDVKTSSNSDQFFDIYERFNPDLLILDIKLNNSRLSGLEVFQRLKKESNFNSQVIILSGEASRLEVAASMQLGAYTFIEKSYNFNSLKFLNEVRQAINLKQQQELTHSLNKDKENLRFGMISETPLIGKSKVMMQVKERIARFAKCDVDVLIQGETGTGKDVVAKQLYLQSNRLGKPFIVVNSGGIAETLVDSELFGHRKGSFTGAYFDKKGFFEQAANGVLFLDEISNINLNVQAKILRAIEKKVIRIVGGEEKAVDIRLIFASNKNLQDLIKEKKFRDDLFYRLDGNIISLPPLRERGDDIIILFNYFCRKISEEQNCKFNLEGKDIAADLKSYNWPGNVRELKKFCEYLFVIYDKFSAEHVRKEIKRKKSGQIRSEVLEWENLLANKDYTTAQEEFDKRYLEYHLKKNNYKVSELAKSFNLNRSTIYQKIKKYKIDI